MRLEEIKLWRDAWQLYVNLKTEINELNEIGNKIQELTGNGNDFQFMNINSPEEESDDDGSYVIQMLDGDGDTSWLREGANDYSYHVHLDSSIKVVGDKDIASVYDKRNAEITLITTIYRLKSKDLTDIANTVEIVKLNK